MSSSPCQYSLLHFSIQGKYHQIALLFQVAGKIKKILLPLNTFIIIIIIIIAYSKFRKGFIKRLGWFSVRRMGGRRRRCCQYRFQFGVPSVLVCAKPSARRGSQLHPCALTSFICFRDYTFSSILYQTCRML